MRFAFETSRTRYTLIFLRSFTSFRTESLATIARHAAQRERAESSYRDSLAEQTAKLRAENSELSAHLNVILDQTRAEQTTSQITIDELRASNLSFRNQNANLRDEAKLLRDEIRSLDINIDATLAEHRLRETEASRP